MEYLPIDGMHHGHNDDGSTISRRTFEHRNHSVEIESTYRIKIDGRLHNIHFTISEDGHATTHMMPYRTYASLVELVSDFIDSFPAEFEGDKNA